MQDLCFRMLTGRPRWLRLAARRILPGDRDGEAVRHEQRQAAEIRLNGQRAVVLHGLAAGQIDGEVSEARLDPAAAQQRCHDRHTAEPKLSSQLRWPLSQRVSCVNFPP